jgi:hypothetical protein
MGHGNTSVLSAEQRLNGVVPESDTRVTGKSHDARRLFIEQEAIVAEDRRADQRKTSGKGGLAGTGRADEGTGAMGRDDSGGVKSLASTLIQNKGQDLI